MAMFLYRRTSANGDMVCGMRREYSYSEFLTTLKYWNKRSFDVLGPGKCFAYDEVPFVCAYNLFGHTKIAMLEPGTELEWPK
jgi:hypothetical protein